LGELDNLVTLYLGYNPLADLPGDVWWLPSLQELDIRGTAITGLPAGLLARPGLTVYWEETAP